MIYNDSFCIKSDTIIQCFKCGFSKVKKHVFSKCLINITEELLNFSGVNNIIAYKYQCSNTIYDECIKKI